MKKAVFALIVVLITAGIANAATEVLNFEGLQNGEEILNYYNGGLGNLGSGPGPSYGIVFGSDSIAGVSIAAGGGTNNYNQPSGSNTCLYFLSGPGDIMNVAAGFTTGFSFYESGPIGGTVNVYSGQNETGTLLASLTLPITPAGSTDGGLVNGAYSVWDPIGVTFSGTAESVNFTGSANFIAFDDITLGSATAGGGTAVPEPLTVFFLGLGLAGIGCRRPVKRPRIRPNSDLQNQPFYRPHPVGGLNFAQGSPTYLYIQ